LPFPVLSTRVRAACPCASTSSTSCASSSVSRARTWAASMASRGVLGACGWQGGSRLSHAGGAGRRGGHHHHIEGLAETGEIADLQTAFVERNALQCGYCTPGMLVAAAELLAKPNQNPRGNPHVPLRQLLSLYRLPRDHRPTLSISSMVAWWIAPVAQSDCRLRRSDVSAASSWLNCRKVPSPYALPRAALPSGG
jgi:aerobic-type carbon monoxide dehydrogenase small subunit (CoxS/CutS family)